MSLSLTNKLLTKGNCGSVTDNVDALSLVFCGFLAVMKVAVLRIHQKKMWVVVDSAINDWSTVVSGESYRVMMKYAGIGRFVFLVQMCGAYAAGFPLIFLKLPLINKLLNDPMGNATFREVPMGPRCWISEDVSTFQYVGEYILQSVQLFIVCTAYIGCDTYFFGIAMHVCGQFEVMIMNIKHLNDSKDNLRLRQRMSNFVRRHNHLLELACNFEETYNVIILAQVGVDIMLICISGIALLMSLDTGDVVIIAGLIIRIYLVYVQLFMYSYVGETLSSNAENLSIAIYDCPWYDMPREITKDIRFIIMRTHYRFDLTAGKLYSMNIENFKTMLTKIGSCFSVLRLVFQESA
nr:odorant receptor 37 [Psyttalia incisi]